MTLEEGAHLARDRSVHCTTLNGTETSVVSQVMLDNMAIGLLVPPGIWAKQEYMVDDAVLMVLASEYYDSQDYIRDYAEFLALRRV